MAAAQGRSPGRRSELTAITEDLAGTPIDTSLPSAERDAFLDEVRTYLPAFLSSATSEQENPVGDVSELLGLARPDLERVIAVHVALSSAIQAFREALPRALRSPISTSLRPLTVTQAVRGPIDWGATVRYRSTAAWASNLYVVRPAERIFDTPENRALKWLLQQLDLELRRVARATEIETEGGTFNEDWLQKIARTRTEVNRARRFHWLRGIPPEYPNSRTLQRLKAQRSAFYKNLVPDAIATLHRLTQNPSPQDVTDLLCQRYFEPERDWKLFELVVALRLARAFSQASARKRRARLLVGVGQAPYARYELHDGGEVRLWYQCWPNDAGPSRHSMSKQLYRIKAGPVRPDIVVERVLDGVRDAVVLELKATRNASYLGQGLFQLLGYLNDCPDLFSRNPSGWLVAPPSPAFETWEPENLTLWVVDSDFVATAAVQRFAPLSS